MKRAKMKSSTKFQIKCWKEWVKSVREWYGSESARFCRGANREAFEHNGAQLISYVNKWRRMSLESLGIL